MILQFVQSIVVCCVLPFNLDFSHAYSVWLVIGAITSISVIDDRNSPICDDDSTTWSRGKIGIVTNLVSSVLHKSVELLIANRCGIATIIPIVKVSQRGPEHQSLIAHVATANDA